MDMIFPISYSPPTGATVTTTDYETPNAAASEKQAKAEDEYIEIGQDRQVSKTQKKRGRRDDGDLVMIVNDDFTVGENFGDHHQEVEGENDGASDAEQCDLGEIQMSYQQHGLNNAE